VVEDEVLDAMQDKEDLESSGHIVVGPAQTVDQGLALYEREQIDFAFLDLQLGDELSIPIAEHLLRRGVPFAFTTGFDDHSILPKQFHQIPCLTKPYAIGGLSRLILNIFTRLEKSDRAAAKQASPPEPTIH
jgi:two-component SAPR family response regulator